MSFNCSTNAIRGRFGKNANSELYKNHAYGNTIYKVLVVFALSSKTVRKVN